MDQWEYKTLTYALQGQVFYSLRFWADSSGKAYGLQERSRWVGGVAHQLQQLETALRELDRDGWELVSVSVWTSFPLTRQGAAVLRRPKPASPKSSI
jgi:hypothetical protein